MNIEKYTREQSKTGSIEIICGSMFSGKTEELIRRAKRAVIARQKICIFKPTIDIRYSREDVVSHNQISIPAFPVEHSRLIRHKSKDYDVVAIDEAQFFDDDIVAVCNDLANAGKRVIVAGLDMDYLGHPFGPMPALMAIADEVTDLSEYTEESAKAFTDALAAAKQLDQEAPTQQQIDDALKALNDAKEALVKKEPAPAAKVGDADGDGEITSTDARLVLQLAAGKIGENDLVIPEAAEVDHDGDITSTDARLILQYAAGKITEWP